MIIKNREALLKKYLIIENRDVNIDESNSEEYINPNYKPPNACTVILESFINNQPEIRNQFPKLIF